MLKWLTQFFKGKKVYRCPHCGCVVPKEEAVVSGWDSQQSLRHIHCPNCGKIMTKVS
jgi:DNA-directed RNA polymerase subunit RPC12/RpoP